MRNKVVILPVQDNKVGAPLGRYHSYWHAAEAFKELYGTKSMEEEAQGSDVTKRT